MKYVSLGRSQIRASALGLGTVKFGRNEKTKYPQRFDLPADESIHELLKTASEIGINLLDTAPAYGRSEERMGEIMDRYGWFGSRASWVVCTKAGEEFSDGVSRYCFDPMRIQESVARSLSRLKTDYVDVALLHSDPEEKCLLEGSEAMNALCKLRAQGIVRVVGASCYSIPGARAAIRQGADTLMLTVNKYDQTFLPLMPELESLGIGILIKKPLNSGFLALAPEEARDAIRFVFERTPAGLTSIIFGTLSPDHLRQHADTAERFFEGGIKQNSD
jgi:aryl-alcohol dehydrogenase-like predicted oxidoreductase